MSSDWHDDWVTHGVRRSKEIEDAVQESVNHAIGGEFDFYVFAGDLTNPDSGSSVFQAVHLALHTAMQLAQKRIHSFWVAGNHDVIEDGTGNTTLLPLKALENTGFVHLFQRPDVKQVNGRFFVALPFTSSTHAYEPAKFATSVRKKVAGPALVIGHLSIPGVQPGEETTHMARGREITFPVEETKNLSEWGTVRVNGHYHRHQVTQEGIIIPGSLARLTFSEENNNPRFISLEV